MAYFFTHIKLVARVLACACAITRIKRRRLLGVLSQMGDLKSFTPWGKTRVSLLRGMGGVCPPVAKNLLIPPPPGKVPPKTHPQIFISPAKGSSPHQITISSYNPIKTSFFTFLTGCLKTHAIIKTAYYFNWLPWISTGSSHWEVFVEINLNQKTLKFYTSWVHWKNQCRLTVSRGRG